MEEKIKAERTIGTVMHLTIEENNIIEDLRRLDKDVYSRDTMLPKLVIIKKMFQMGISAFRKELLNESE